MPTYVEAGVGPNHDGGQESARMAQVATFTAPCPTAADIASFMSRKEEVRAALSEYGSLYFDKRSDGDEGHNHVGLLNQGATCYMNSLLQALFMTPIFRERLFAWRGSGSSGGSSGDGLQPPTPATSIPREMQRLFASLLLSSQSAVSTKDLTTAFGKDFHR